MAARELDRTSTADIPLLSGPVRDWFRDAFPLGPTPAQASAWPSISSGRNVLLVSPTGTGKTLAAFLAIIDDLYRRHLGGSLGPGVRCVYVSPLRSLGYDIERNLSVPLDAIRARLGLEESPIRVGVRTGDTSAYQRRKLRDQPPHLLITTPESLSLMLSQSRWHATWETVEHLILDEIHSLVPTKRGADLAASIERLAARAGADPKRIGLSATCDPAEPVARFLVGPTRSCETIIARSPEGTPPLGLSVESLIRPDEAPHRGLTYRRLVRRIREATESNRTTVVFANTRGLTEKITHDLRGEIAEGDSTVAAHHSALDAERRRDVEARLKAGELKAVVTSTSLELGVDIGQADLSVLVGLPGSSSRCLQRVGRAGHRVDAQTRGVLLAATGAEVAGGLITVEAARLGRVEPLRIVDAPLDVLCQQLLGMACGGECSVDEAEAILKKSAPFANLRRSDLDACMAFLAGELSSPPGAYEPEPGSTPRWTSPRLWKKSGLFGVKNGRIVRWFWSNVGTITSEESIRVQVDGKEVGTLEGAYAERLQAGDRFVLDGRALEFRRIENLTVFARSTGGDPDLPRWTSDRQGLSAMLARDLAAFRAEAGRIALEGPAALRSWLVDVHDIGPDEAGVIESLIQAQDQASEIPAPSTLLVEEYPAADGSGLVYAFHAPLGRPASEAMGRAVASRLGKRFGQDLALVISDLGFSIRIPDPGRIDASEIGELIGPEDFSAAVLDGLDRGELPARRFRHVAATALMVLRRPEGGRTRVGGLLWVSQRLFPLVKAACPDHPLLRETEREVLQDVLDAPSAVEWLGTRPAVRFRVLDRPSPFAAAWIDPGGAESVAFESPAEALRRLHKRLISQ